MALLDIVAINPVSKQLEVPNLIDEYNMPKPVTVPSIKFVDGTSQSTAASTAFHGFAGTPTPAIPEQPLTPNVWTALQFTAVYYDTDGSHSVGLPTRMLIPAGYTKARLRINVMVIGATDGLTRSFHVRRNGTFVMYSRYIVNGPANYEIVTARLSVVPGDYFEIFAFTTALADTFNGANSVVELELLP